MNKIKMYLTSRNLSVTTLTDFEKFAKTGISNFGNSIYYVCANSTIYINISHLINDFFT